MILWAFKWIAWAWFWALRIAAVILLWALMQTARFCIWTHSLLLNLTDRYVPDRMGRFK